MKFKWEWERTKDDLDAFQLWMVKRNLEDIKNGAPKDERIASLKAQGYLKVANAVANAC